MRSHLLIPLAAATVATSLIGAAQARAQDNPTGDPIVQKIYDEGMHHSQLERLAQPLMDSIGPRLTGSSANRAANDYLLKTYKSWGIDARNEKYGTWRDWTRGNSTRSSSATAQPRNGARASPAQASTLVDFLQCSRARVSLVCFRTDGHAAGESTRFNHRAPATFRRSMFHARTTRYSLAWRRTVRVHVFTQ